MRNRDFIVFGQPDIQQEDIREVVAALESLWIGTGPKAHEFEGRFGDYVDAPYTVGTCSGTAALHLGLIALNVGVHDEVVVPALTFPATANVVVHVGATPVFADVDRATRNLSAETLLPVITDRTRTVMPVLLGGYPADLDALKAAATTSGATMLVDAAHAIETQYKGRRLGALADATAYSFYATKNITTADGGMLTTPSENLARRVRMLGYHGLSADAWSRYSGDTARLYEVIEPGFKYNLTDLQAALGLRQLARIEASWERRRAIWKRYNNAFADLPLELPPTPAPEFGRSSLHLYSPLLDTDRTPFDRDTLRETLRQRGVGTGVHFTALHLHAYYRERFGYRGGEFPQAEDIGARTFSLPLSPRLRDDQVDRIIDTVCSLLQPFS
ncbi:DegT/DnrJ/EryC1/StrS family aminotransferase [Candidatus Methylomirabilis sp.]|uniref:DegT/DnrJ/EryC1/StrS family aminotransferase n=1 Tax=Candidatus Methylomirabilis sp. TaxID=2032687 RepID=UPI003076366A